MNLFKNKDQEGNNRFKPNWNWLLLASVGFLLVFAISINTSSKWEWADWTGFGEDSNISQEETLQNGKLTVTKRITHFQSRKTLWDWLGLLGVIAIPVALFYFQQQEQKRSDKQSEAEKEIAAINLREEAIQNYIDRIADLLIDKKMRSLFKLFTRRTSLEDSPEFDELDAILDLIHARTLSILRRLDGDGERKGSVVRFLIDTELIQGFSILKEANLIGANLSVIDISYINLCKADLSNAMLPFSIIKGANLCLAKLVNTNLIKATLDESDLRYTEFDNAYLIDAKLQRANLYEANLEGANLEGANLKGANLEGANIKGANLEGTNLEGANLKGANLKGAKNLDVKQVKAALNWELAHYDSDFGQQLGLLPGNTV